MENVILSRIFLAYLKIVDMTSHITYSGLDKLKDSNVVGFWHEDSFVSHLVLKEIGKFDQKATVLVTGKWRGNVIQEMVEHFEGEVFRVSYKEKTVEQFKRLFQDAKTTSNLVVMAFDGPKGPRHKIKKIAFLLSNKNNKNLVAMKVKYKRKIRLFGRWDHYVIPLLFSKIQVQFLDFGTISREDLQDTNEKNEYILEELNRV